MERWYNAVQSPKSIAAEVRMRRTLHDGSFLVVEGKDDVRFWATRRHARCRLVDGGGKRNVVRGLQRLDEIGFAGALGVVDSNHDYLAGRALPSTNLVATDAHDLECLLCRSSAFQTVLVEFGHAKKIKQFERESGVDVRAALLERALTLDAFAGCCVEESPAWGCRRSDASLRRRRGPWMARG